MNLSLLSNIALVVLVGFFVACGHAEKKRVVVKPKKSKPVVEKSPKVVSHEVTAVESYCSEGEGEKCNALDDNCDGVIDEGCGYRSGAIQITVGWDSGADIDLYVTDPAGETICFRKDERRSASGGHMDHDSRGDCRTQQEINRIENVYWEGSRPLEGDYRVELHYFSPCGHNQETTTTISISVAGRILGVYQRVVQPEERVNILTFTLD
jgi:hypothetical protein